MERYRRLSAIPMFTPRVVETNHKQALQPFICQEIPIRWLENPVANTI